MASSTPIANQDVLKESDGPQEEILRLKALLEEERKKCQDEKIKVINFSTELEEMTAQWKRQKQLTEMFINRKEETKKEMQRLLRYSDPEARRNAEMASKVHNTFKRMNKKVLHRKYEKLQAAYKLQKKNMTEQLTMKKRENKALQQEVEKVKMSCKELCCKYEGEVRSMKRRAATLQDELNKKTKAHADKVAQDTLEINTLRAEKRDHQKTVQDPSEVTQHLSFEEEEAPRKRKKPNVKNQNKPMELIAVIHKLEVEEDSFPDKEVLIVMEENPPLPRFEETT